MLLREFITLRPQLQHISITHNTPSIHSTMKASIVATIIATLAVVSASPLQKRDDYANFFDDDNCSVNGGIGVDLGNNGCLGEAGRGSVYIPRSADYTSTLTLQIFGGGGCGSGAPSSTWDFTATGEHTPGNYPSCADIFSGFCHKLNPSDQQYSFCQPGFNCAGDAGIA